MVERANLSIDEQQSVDKITQVLLWNIMTNINKNTTWTIFSTHWDSLSSYYPTLSTSGHLDSGWDVEADQGQLALSPQVAKIKLCLTLILVGNIVVNQDLPGHLNINLNTNQILLIEY